MKILKNNIVKITLAAACLVCGILMLIPVFMLKNFNFTGACQTIGMIIFFAGIAAVIVLSICDKTKKIGKFALLATGILSLIFMSIGFCGLSKTKPEGAVGKAYAYFANVESTVAAGEITLAQKQEELNAKKAELSGAKTDVTGLGLLAAGWSTIAGGFTASDPIVLFGTVSGDAYAAGINVSATKIKDIVSDPQIVSGHPAYAAVAELNALKAQIIGAGLGDQTLSSAPYVIGGIVEASSQSFPKLEEAIGQLQGVIDMNAAELAAGKAQIEDANAAAKTIMFLYICLMFSMCVAPVIIGAKKILCKKD